MMTASSIIYDIDEEKKIITAKVSDCSTDALYFVLKAFRHQNLILSDVYVKLDENEDITVGPLTTCKKYLMKDTYTGMAIYDPSDPNPFSIERGKEIARRRLYDAYNKDYLKVMTNITTAIKNVIETDLKAAMAITEERLINFKYYEFYDIFKKNLEESTKL